MSAAPASPGRRPHDRAGARRPGPAHLAARRRTCLALALPDELAVAAVVVVTQTLVEVIGMIAYVRLVPRLVPADSTTPVGVS
ncbi:hypothetical protein ACFXB3_00575 [Streptomyces sp. NPDC059447]|uniref:hypothetical protein n=1 Tax=Streptomyces sp. NPDC059447 TaxID=3346834 RepID=UPI0036A6E920